MDRTFKRIIMVGLLFIALAAGAVALVVSGGCSASTVPDFKNGALNMLIDVSGVKGRLDSELRERAGEIAEGMGIPRDYVNEVVDDLDIPDWTVTSLPPHSVETGTFSMTTREGLPISVTTYEDDGVVTVGAFDQQVTMAVPESARPYVELVSSIQYLT